MRINFGIVPYEHPYHYGALLEMPSAQQCPFCRKYIYDITVLRLSFDFSHSPGKYPWVKPEKTLVLALFQNYLSATVVLIYTTHHETLIKLT